MKLFLAILFLFSAASVNAQDFQSKSKKKRKQQRQKVITFDDQLVEGQTKSPDLFYLLQKKQFNYKRLIKLRKNFVPEMTATAEDLKADGSTD